ncbi:BZ3500_MvSof-1268-A1-R1_Chr8-1g09721 [Microbotryum saponariae]|uniref:BZ3500_MvSof-1268-A1-R1_Chr8-1g09721 protein n=1 Tax=Microbotryum saponariae TaxID=289078 RepID=A0A2X0KV37_9BASI|nr:BZ3500_MvSof-1268-A1-R1_Chr8-1g09721 [Microbotryum saponariae]SDA08007.1 BZ3501_MvSof-1269-A2-R1_Chr8-1g09444 [Microbotryum saponariae]
MKEAPTPLADGERTALLRVIPNGWADPNFARDKPASSSRHPKGSSWKLCNEYGTNFLKNGCSMQRSYGFDISLQHVFVECQPSSCFPPPSIGDCIHIGSSVTGGDPIPEKRGHPPWPVWENDIDAHKHPIFYNNAREGSRPRENTAEGLTSKNTDSCNQPITQKNRLWFRGLRLTIPWQILNDSVRGSDRRVGRKSEAMPSRYSTSSPAQIVDACIMNADFWTLY